MSVNLEQIVMSYDVELNGKDYVLISTENTNGGYTDYTIMLNGEPVEGQEFDSVMNYFSSNV